MTPKHLMCLLLFTASLAKASNDHMLRTLPRVCSSEVDISTPGDPHDLVQARRIIFNQMTQQSVLGRYATRAYNLSNSSDIFKPEYLLENLYHGFQFDADTGVISLFATADKIVGTLRPGKDSHYWLSIGVETSPEDMTCQ
jgi:hypothetical protein